MLTPEEEAALEGEARAVEGDVVTAAEQAAGASSETEEAPKVPTGKVVGEMLKATFTRLAPAWEVTGEECEALGEAYGAVLDKYFPNGMGVEATAVGVTLLVIGPRLGTPRKHEEPKKDDETPSAPSG